MYFQSFAFIKAISGYNLPLNLDNGPPPMRAGDIIPFVILLQNISPVKVASFKTVNKNLCGRNVSSNGNIVHIAKAEHIHIVWLVRLGVQRISEEKEHINFIAGNSCGNLLGCRPENRQGIFEL